MVDILVENILSSKSQGGIMNSYESCSKLFTTELIKRKGYPTAKNLLRIIKVYFEKSVAILLALCSSVLIVFLLYFKGILEDQCGGILLAF